MPAVGIDTCTPSAMTGNSPIGLNSVVPMPNAPMASASSGQLKRRSASSREIVETAVLIVNSSSFVPSRREASRADEATVRTGTPADRGHILIAQREIEDRDILGHALGLR